MKTTTTQKRILRRANRLCKRTTCCAFYYVNHVTGHLFFAITAGYGNVFTYYDNSREYNWIAGYPRSWRHIRTLIASARPSI